MFEILAQERRILTPAVALDFGDQADVLYLVLSPFRPKTALT